MGATTYQEQVRGTRSLEQFVKFFWIALRLLARAAREMPLKLARRVDRYFYIRKKVPSLPQHPKREAWLGKY